MGEREEWEAHQQRKQKYRQAGIPVGLGIPREGELPEHIREQERQQKWDEDEQNFNDYKMGQDVMNDQEFTQPYMQNDKAKIVQYVNTCEPQKYGYHTGEDGVKRKVVVEGEVPPEVFFAPGMHAYYSHNATMSNLDEYELREHHQKAETIINVTVGAMEEDEFSPEMFAKMEGAEAQIKLRINSNKQTPMGVGQERYLIAAEIHDQHKTYGSASSGSRARNIWNAVKGE